MKEAWALARHYGAGRLLTPLRDRIKPLRFDDEFAVAMFASRARQRIDKARRLLGYEPQFGLERGMAITSEYIRWARL